MVNDYQQLNDSDVLFLHSEYELLGKKKEYKK